MKARKQQEEMWKHKRERERYDSIPIQGNSEIQESGRKKREGNRDENERQIEIEGT